MIDLTNPSTIYSWNMYKMAGLVAMSEFGYHFYSYKIQLSFNVYTSKTTKYITQFTSEHNKALK